MDRFLSLRELINISSGYIKKSERDAIFYLTSFFYLYIFLKSLNVRG